MSNDESLRSAPSPEGTPISAEEAERLLRARVEELPPDSREHVDAIWNLMRFLSLTCRQEEGLRLLETLLTIVTHPEGRAEIVLATGQLMEQLGDYSAAVGAYSKGVALEPVGLSTWYLLHNNLGFSLNQLGRYAEGERWCREAVRIDPERSNAHKNLGLACEGQGRNADAVRCFVAAVRSNASDPRALRHLEALVARSPEIRNELPDVEDQIASCRAAVEAAQRARPAMPGRPPG